MSRVCQLGNGCGVRPYAVQVSVRKERNQMTKRNSNFCNRHPSRPFIWSGLDLLDGDCFSYVAYNTTTTAKGGVI